MTVGRYLTPEDVQLGLTGLAAGSVAGAAWRLAGRLRWSGLPFVVAVLGAARWSARSDWPQWDGMAAMGLLILVTAGLGAARLLARRAVGWGWVAAGALGSAAGIWGAVPETGPVLLAGGAVAGLIATAALTGARWTPTAGLGVGAVLGWAALSGAAGRPWAAVGGALCTGLGPWFAICPLRRPSPRRGAAGPWLLAVHIALSALAARWIGVVPDAGWFRVAVVAAAGLAVAAAARRKA